MRTDDLVAALVERLFGGQIGLAAVGAAGGDDELIGRRFARGKGVGRKGLAAEAQKRDLAEAENGDRTSDW